MITPEIAKLVENAYKGGDRRRPKRRPRRRLSGPRLTPAEKGHRAMLAPVIDRLVRADDEQRRIAVERVRASAAPDTLALVLDLLSTRARRTPRPEVRRGALHALAQFGAPGAVLTGFLALNGTSPDLRAAAAEAVIRYGHALPPEAGVELYLYLIRMRANTADPRVARACGEILLALWGDDPVLRHQLARFAPAEQPGVRGGPPPTAG